MYVCSVCLHWDLDAFPRAKKGGCPLIDVSLCWFFTCFLMHFWAPVHASQLQAHRCWAPPPRSSARCGTLSMMLGKSNGVSPVGNYRDSTLISKGRWLSVRGGDIERKSFQKKNAFLGWWTTMNSLNLSRVFVCFFLRCGLDSIISIRWSIG